MPKFEKVKCFLCEQGFRFEPGIYEGRRLGGWGVMACNGCYNSNWDGWVPQYGEKLAAKVVAEGRELPARNASGFYPRDF